MNNKTKEILIGFVKWILAALFGIGGIWNESDLFLSGIEIVSFFIYYYFVE